MIAALKIAARRRFPTRERAFVRSFQPPKHWRRLEADAIPRAGQLRLRSRQSTRWRDRGRFPAIDPCTRAGRCRRRNFGPRGKWPAHGENRRSRHESKDDPQNHESQQHIRREAQMRTHLTGRGYIITAPLRPQWEQRRGNCALVVRSRAPNCTRGRTRMTLPVRSGHSDRAGSRPQRLCAGSLGLAPFCVAISAALARRPA